MAQSLDDILKEHFSAIGQDSIIKVNTQKLTGKMIQGGIEIPFIQMAKRPDKIRVEGTFQGLTFIQTYNGKEGWSLNPFAGVTDPQPRSEDDLKGMHYQADMDGMLWNWNEKGYTVTFDGKDDMEGTSCFKIKLDAKRGIHLPIILMQIHTWRLRIMLSRSGILHLRLILCLKLTFQKLLSNHISVFYGMQ